MWFPEGWISSEEASPSGFSTIRVDGNGALRLKSRKYADADAYLADLGGWRDECVRVLRKAVRSHRDLDERIKWGHLVYEFEGPVLLIRAEEERVLFGFWRGKRLRDIEPRLKPGGKYEMATMEFREGDSVTSETIHQLVDEAIRLNRELGNPQDAARRK